MKTLRSLLTPFRATTGRFDRYYGGILRPGSGYPTADEARKDLRNRDHAVATFYGWLR